MVNVTLFVVNKYVAHEFFQSLSHQEITAITEKPSDNEVSRASPPHQDSMTDKCP